MSDDAPAPRFFLDRGLGARLVPAGLRTAGWQVTTMDERYGAEVSQHVADTDWIRDATALGECLLTKDTAIARRPAEAQAVVMNDARVFALSDARATGQDMLRCFLAHQVAIHRWAVRVPAPFVVAVSRQRLRRAGLAYP
ncbi:MAG TPA: hypothetical protein VGC57_07290 [Cellulomonas sp.]